MLYSSDAPPRKQKLGLLAKKLSTPVTAGFYLIFVTCGDVAEEFVIR